MSQEIKKMTPKEFRELGLLQEVNRLFLHPRGLALGIEWSEDEDEVFGQIWDYRDDPEGIAFSEPMSLEAAEYAEMLYGNHSTARRRLFGTRDNIQPIDKPIG